MVKVFALLIRGVAGQPVNLPDFAAIIPYLGLYTLVPLHPETLENLAIPTPHLPSLSIIQDDRFVPAPADTPPTAPNVARIFDALSLPDSAPIAPGLVPLSSSSPEFGEQRYWRLPVKQGVVLELLMQQAISLPGHYHVAVRLARAIYSILTLQIFGLDAENDKLDHSGPRSSGGASRDNQGHGRQRRKKDKDDRGSPDSPRRGRTGRGRTVGGASKEAGTNSPNESANDFSELILF